MEMTNQGLGEVSNDSMR